MFSEERSPPVLSFYMATPVFECPVRRSHVLHSSHPPGQGAPRLTAGDRAVQEGRESRDARSRRPSSREERGPLPGPRQPEGGGAAPAAAAQPPAAAEASSASASERRRRSPRKPPRSRQLPARGGRRACQWRGGAGSSGCAPPAPIEGWQNVLVLRCPRLPCAGAWYRGAHWCVCLAS